MKKLNKLTKEEIKKITDVVGNEWKHPKTKKVRYYLNATQILEFYGNVFNFDSDDYQTFLTSKVWIEGKEVFTDNQNKKIIVKISDNIAKLLELRF